MSTNRKIQTTELDFDGIKQNLREYLEGQSEFSDYNFEGSGLSILLDLLSYNTHYNALYTNLAVNEAFLDSASKRSSVVSKAKELGYTPASAKSSTAIVDVVIVNNNIESPNYLEIPRYSVFTAKVNDTTYSFYTNQTQISQRVDNQYIFDGVEIKEGTYLEFRYTISAGTKVVIPNTNVDLSTITVSVQDSAQSSTATVFFPYTNIINIGADDPVYFVKELDNGLYEIEFGNGVIGKALNQGNVVTLTYIVCNSTLPNGANTFTYGGVLPDGAEAFVLTQTPASGGGDAESIESIKWNAPRSYAAQNRAVTADDYRVLINSMYPEIQSINVWGGENNDPPIYGKVFISVVPNNEQLLTDSEKDYILTEIINPRKALSVTPEFVDPTYLKIGLNVSFYYNPQKTTRNANDIASLVLQTIRDYDATNLNTFGGVFKYSRLGTLIDQTEPSITSNITTVTLYREVTPIFNVSAEYTIKINNPLDNSDVAGETILSTGFLCTDSPEVCYMEDIPVKGSNIGTLRIFYRNSAGEKINVKSIGTLNYSTGTLNIKNLTITGLASSPFLFTIAPQSYDVVAIQNQFATIDFDQVTVTPIMDNTSQPYKFTSSRS